MDTDKQIAEVAYLMGRVAGLLSKEEVLKFFKDNDVSKCEIDDLIWKLTDIANAFYK